LFGAKTKFTNSGTPPPTRLCNDIYYSLINCLFGEKKEKSSLKAKNDYSTRKTSFSPWEA
jgi:hypothetical protein